MKRLIACLLISITVSAQAATLAIATISTFPSAVVPANFLGLAMEWCKSQTLFGQASLGGADAIAAQMVANLTGLWCGTNVHPHRR